MFVIAAWVFRFTEFCNWIFGKAVILSPKISNVILDHIIKRICWQKSYYTCKNFRKSISTQILDEVSNDFILFYFFLSRLFFIYYFTNSCAASIVNERRKLEIWKSRKIVEDSKQNECKRIILKKLLELLFLSFRLKFHRVNAFN